MKLDVSRCLLLIIVALGLVGCMPAISSEASFLLGQDYLRMTNPEFKYLQYNKVQGLPFTIIELEQHFDKILED